MSIIKGMIYTTLLGNLEGKTLKVVVRNALVFFVCRFHLVCFSMYFTFTNFKCQKGPNCFCSHCIFLDQPTYEMSQTLYKLCGKQVT